MRCHHAVVVIISLGAAATGNRQLDRSTPALQRLPETGPRIFRDCSDCPQMVVVPAGTFTMGSSASEKSWAVGHGATAGSVADEAPQHQVSIRRFALARYDVTRAEYAAFVRATGYPIGDGCGLDGGQWKKLLSLSWRSPGFDQSPADPVVCVSWSDAHAYMTWLNEKVRRSGDAGDSAPYRLPTESEWEYAARGQSLTRFWWGDDDSRANTFAWYKANSGARTHPAGLKPANPFGLYDMSGDVWQWTADCYAESYVNAPGDGTAATGSSSCLRVDRGSSWRYPAWMLRPATRERNPPDFRDTMMGFRVAKSLP